MKKFTTKQENQALHKISILSSLLIDSIEDLGIGDNGQKAEVFKGHLEEVEKICEIIVDSSAVKEIKSSTYIQDIVNKVDTIIRKNFKDI